MRLLTRKRGNSNRDIFKQFYEHTAETADDNRAEKRIALYPDNHFDALRSHTLHHSPGDFSSRKLSSHTLVKAAEGIADFRRSRKSQRHSADVAFVAELSRLDFESHRETDAFGNCGGFFGA